MSVLPGASYTEKDLVLFDRIEAAVRRARISRRDEERLAFELDDARLREHAPESVLLRALDFLPDLHFLLPSLQLLKPTVFVQPGPLKRATGMLLTIVTARLRYLEQRVG